MPSYITGPAEIIHHQPTAPAPRVRLIRPVSLCTRPRAVQRLNALDMT